MKMGDESRSGVPAMVPLSLPVLQQLKEQGFQFVQVKGFSNGQSPEYGQAQYLLLVPIRALSDDPAKQDIYEPLDSEILIDWANSPNDGVKIFVTRP